LSKVRYPLIGAMCGLALVAMAACTAWPGMQVTYAMPNAGAVSGAVQKVWMNTDGGIRSEVLSLLQANLSNPADSGQNKRDLERMGFDCGAAVQPRCTHVSKVDYRPTGPTPQTGSAPRTVKIEISTTTQAPLTELSVQKTNETHQ